MGTKQVGKLLQEITPSFRHARKVRNDIKTHYRKNIRNVDSGRPVKTYINQSTHWLGDNLEEQHMNLEVKFAEVGDEKTRGSTITSGGERQKKYNIPDEYKSDLKQSMGEFISGIKTRNLISMLLEFLTYLAFILVIVSISLILAGQILPILP